MNKRFSLRILLLVMTAICIAFSAYSFVGANWVTMKAVDRIELGMEKAQVREILGDPKSIENGKWVYEVWIGRVNHR
jgi:outer membrane protein assembly factor BamE (lipoprotein component of BamABCDE complex)